MRDERVNGGALARKEREVWSAGYIREMHAAISATPLRCRSI